METVHVLEELDAPIDRVWEAVRDFGDVRAWAPEAKLLGVEGEGVGAIRRIETPGGLFVERCEALEPEAHRFSYAVLECPVPFRDYVAVVQLSALDGGRCAIEWSCEFEAASEAATALREGVENTYRNGFIAALRASLAA
jgi:hypothetical protein